MYWLWLSSSKMTVAIAVDLSSKLITDGPPIVRKFLGQPASNLIRWMSKQTGYKQAVLHK